MDGAIKSKRLYPSYNTAQLYDFLRAQGNTNAQQEKFQLAIRQRDPISQDYIPHFSVPQVIPKPAIVGTTGDGYTVHVLPDGTLSI